MKLPIVIISIESSIVLSERWHFVALIIKEGCIPKYYSFSMDGECSDIENLRIYISELKEFLQDSGLFVFDIRLIPFLNKILEINLISSEIIDMKELVTIFYPFSSNQSLEELSTKIGAKIKNRYISTAHKEVRLTWEVLKSCWNKGLNSELGYINKLEELTKGLACEQFIGFLKKEIIKQYPDRPINQDQGICLIGSGPNLFGVDTENFHEKINFSSRWVTDCFKEGGLLSDYFPGYESRTSQIIMAEAIISGFTECKDTIIEAGTGTGKSIAYLIPALWWSKKNSKKVVVATHTINLQEQLFNKDLPFLQKILPFNFKIQLLKGKSNYICLKSLHHDKEISELNAKERLAYVGLYSWSRETLTGDIGEISHLENLNLIWSKYGADNPYCEPGECQFTKQCHMLRARKKAEEADLIVINHSLLLADIKTNNKVLPEYNNLIVDEAHNIYQTALKQLGFEVNLEKILRITESLISGKGSLIYTLKKNKTIWSTIFPLVYWEDFYNNTEKVLVSSHEVVDQSKELFGLCQSVLAERINLRIDENKISQTVFNAIKIAIENLISRLKNLNEILNKLSFSLTLENEQFENVKSEINRIKSNISQIIDGLNEIVVNKEDRVTYLEKGRNIYLKNTCINIAEILKEKIFNRKESTILTSATLSVANSFEYFAGDIGLENYCSIKLDSPFDFNSQMLLCVVNDMPVNQLSESVLAAKAASFIKEIVETMNGRTLVLFTSHRYLRLVYNELQRHLADSNFKLFAQGIHGTRDILLKNFIKNKKSILLGSNSFWEGIDIPGDSLKCVIMTKLPFWPPDTPIVEAKAKLLENQGRDPFKELHLPEAIIRFKQGFGRLIRTKEDKGVVILLDDRVINKYYGKFFLKSLPIISYYEGSAENVLTQTSYWV